MFASNCVSLVLRAGIAIAATILAFAPASRAALYDVVSDFSPTNNPNGVWKYGTTSTLGGGFSQLAGQTTCAGEGWGSGGAIFPLIVKNLYGVTVHCNNAFVSPNELLLHPGQSGQLAVIRFTAPSADTYFFNGQFYGVEPPGASTDVHVLANSVAMFNDFVIGTGAPHLFSGSVALLAGGTLDFAVGFGPDNNYQYDATGLMAVICTGESCVSNQAPTPGALALLGLGLLGLGATRRRKAA